jgi:acylphosphatase
MNHARAHVMISGRVQGVFFRYKTQEQAQNMGVAGWVRNLPDGRVEAVLEGGQEDVERMMQWCRQAPPMAEVEDVDVQWEDFKGEFDSFSVRY